MQAIELLSSKKQRLLIGGLHYQGQTYNGAIVVPPKGEKVNSGQILVEMTPTYYEMTSFANGRLRQVTSADVTMDNTVTIDSQDNSDEGQVVKYQYFDSIYFGKGQNIPTGSDVVLNNQTRAIESQKHIERFRYKYTIG